MKPIVIEELELAPPHDEEVLVKLLYAGLCHSDLSVINASRPRPTPMALGHEAVGRIQQVGKNVDNVQVGDIVSCVFVPSCGTCDSCRTGRPATCTTGSKANGAGLLLCGQSHLSRQVSKPTDPKVIHHLLGVAAFSTYSVMNKNSVVKIDPSIPPKYAAVFGCAVITGVVLDSVLYWEPWLQVRVASSWSTWNSLN
ncbi:Alcohol dehydrogenase 1A [Galdieria sulphuraria]|nr:Alcohol dehydrogenase 1A [Galdieria sulphuraria]